MSLAPTDPRRYAGFTILELMLAMAILGLLAAVAIPNFLHYQATSRRSEAFTNVQAIANMEITYFGEHDTYFQVPVSYPDPAGKPSGVLDIDKMAWDAASSAAFSALGWAPEGWVFFSYEVNTDCNALPSFTVTGFGDVDADTFVSAVQYGKADSAGFLCGGSSFPIGAPTRPEEVIVNALADAH